MIDNVVIDIANVMGKLSQNIANDQVYKNVNQAQRTKLFDEH